MADKKEDKVTQMKQSSSKWSERSSPAGHNSPVGTTFAFNLNEEAQVTLTFTMEIRGHTLSLGELSLSGHPGINGVRFQGAITSKTKLAPGSYTVIVVAANTADQQSTPNRLKFRILAIAS